MTRLLTVAATIDNTVIAGALAPVAIHSKRERRKLMDFYNVPIGFGLALSANTTAMNRYSHLSEAQRQELLRKAHNVRSEKEMYALVASLANGTMQ